MVKLLFIACILSMLLLMTGCSNPSTGASQSTFSMPDSAVGVVDNFPTIPVNRIRNGSFEVFTAAGVPTQWIFYNNNEYKSVCDPLPFPVPAGKYVMRVVSSANSSPIVFKQAISFSSKKIAKVNVHLIVQSQYPKWLRINFSGGSRIFNLPPGSSAVTYATICTLTTLNPEIWINSYTTPVGKTVYFDNVSLFDISIPVEKVLLSQSEMELVVGSGATLTAAVLPSTATDKRIMWTSENNAIATVVNGTVLAVAEGTTNIVATSLENQKTAQCRITVMKHHILYNPYKMRQYWYRGALHCHSGPGPDVMAAAYKNLGYDFFCLTESTPIMPSPLAGLLLIQSQEVYTGNGHLNCFNITSEISTSLQWQEIIDNALSQGGFSQFNHPIASGITAANMNPLKNLWGIEIYNPTKNNDGAEALWDSQISQVTADKTYKMVWATAGDDAKGSSVNDIGKGWIMVNASAKSISEIVSNMKIGNFYATQGPDMSFATVGNTITVKTSNSSTIAWMKSSMILAKPSVTGTSDSYTIVGTEGFVRVVISQTGGKCAWSQPIFTK
ncbi:MAG: Ig domain-containing protein [Chitinivibrionales bacterium]|nr:Ig domain-containing protein [Chitinivibrionales bacterium]